MRRGGSLRRLFSEALLRPDQVVSPTVFRESEDPPWRVKKKEERRVPEFQESRESTVLQVVQWTPQVGVFRDHP